jgi:hypothetical protein
MESRHTYMRIVLKYILKKWDTNVWTLPVFCLPEGPISKSTRCTATLGLLCCPVLFFQPRHTALSMPCVVLSAQAHCPVYALCCSFSPGSMPCLSYKETQIFYWGHAYIFRSSKELPKEIITLTSQGLAAANNMLRSFSLHLAKSAVWLTIKQAHNIQVLLHRSMAREECYHRSQLMPA